MTEKICRVVRKYPLSLIVLATIVYLSFFKPPTIPITPVKYFDKIVHFLMYGGLCFILWLEYFLTHSKIQVKRVFWWTIVAPILFSGVVELMQEYLTKHRGGDIVDFLFNSLGVLCAALFSVFVTKPFVIKYKLWNKRGKD